MVPASNCARPSSRDDTGTTVAVTTLAFRLRQRALVARAGDDADLLVGQVQQRVAGGAAAHQQAVPSTKVSDEKATSFMRPSVTWWRRIPCRPGRC